MNFYVAEILLKCVSTSKFWLLQDRSNGSLYECFRHSCIHQKQLVKYMSEQKMLRNEAVRGK